MPVLFKNPVLEDYFTKVGNVRADMPVDAVPSIVRPYESARVLYFRDLKFAIDHDFWASLPTEGFPRLKKLSSSPGAGDFQNDPVLERRLQDANVPIDLERRLRREINRLYEQVLPVYEGLFKGYRFVRRQIVWRLNTVRNENLHIDTYANELKDHFARLFINLDNQPRIWMTSYGIDALYERFGDRIPREILTEGSASQMHVALNNAAFGGRSTVWWDRQPRHVAYFDPGDVWAVDSRQVSHQIFYGRRAVSIDFFVDRGSMAKPKRHYFAIAEANRARLLANSSPAAAAAE